MNRLLCASHVVMICGLCTWAPAATVFQAAPGTDITVGANWNNGLPRVGNDGTIATSGTFPGQYNLSAPGPGTVIVTHSAGTLTAIANTMNVHNTGNTAVFAWNQTGGNVSVQLLNPNVGVVYTLSGTGTITANGVGGSRILPYNTGQFRQTGGTLVNMGVDVAYGVTMQLSGGSVTGCGAYIPTQAVWAHGSSAAKISIGGGHTIAFATAVAPAGVVLLENGAQLVFDPAWSGRWIRDGFTAADWETALTDTGVKVGNTQVTSVNFGSLFNVALAGGAGSYVTLKPRPAIAKLPAVTSATLTFHLNAEDMYNDGGIWDPGDGNNIAQWTELKSGVGVSIQATPSWHATALGGKPAVRFFDDGSAYTDLIYCNNPPINSVPARTIIAVASMVADTRIYSDLVSNSSGELCIRQDAETAAYYTGNSGDFIYGGGSLVINGEPRFSLPGGYGSAHVVKAVSSSLKTYASLRIGDNANNRRWSGDVAELIVFNNVLDGNDTARVNRYLANKYGIPQTVDGRITDTSQVATNPFPGADLRRVGVNFYYAPGGDVATKLFGIGFDNINLTGGSPPTGPFTLVANLPATTLQCTWTGGWNISNNERTQAPGISGTDAATLNAVAGEMFYLGTTEHNQVLMTFSGLGKSHEVYAQVFGGDSGWLGDIAVTANGVSVGTWTTVADGNGGTASLFCFRAATDAAGTLALRFTAVGSYSGIGGLLLTELVPPTQGTLFLAR